MIFFEKSSLFLPWKIPFQIKDDAAKSILVPRISRIVQISLDFARPLYTPFLDIDRTRPHFLGYAPPPAVAAAAAAGPRHCAIERTSERPIFASIITFTGVCSAPPAASNHTPLRLYEIAQWRMPRRESSKWLMLGRWIRAHVLIPRHNGLNDSTAAAQRAPTRSSFSRRHDEESGGVSFVRHLLSIEVELEFSTLLLLTDYCSPFSLFNFAPPDLSSRSSLFFFFLFSFLFRWSFAFFGSGWLVAVFQSFERTFVSLRLRSLIFFLYHTDIPNRKIIKFHKL